MMDANDALTLARRWANRGIPAFPVAIGHDGTRMSKRPLCAHGHHDATTNPSQLDELFKQANPSPGEVLAVGLWPGPAGHAVVDVDVKDGAAGDETWATLTATNGTIDTYTATTPSGGYHLWGGKDDHHIGNAKTLGPGIDVRADAGWVVAPGVTTPWGSWEHEASSPPWPPAPWPNWILGRLNGNGHTPDGYTPINTSKADVNWWMATPTIGPGERHASLISAAGWCRRRAMTADAAMTFLGGVLARHRPARHTPDDIARIIDDIYQRYPAGTTVDTHTTATPAIQTDIGRHVDLTPAASIQPLRVRWTWDGRIATGTIALLAGPEGLGKSTVAYSLAAQLSRGTLEGEHYGTPKGVLICATEDSWAHTIVPRLMAHNADLNRVYRVQVKDAEDIDQGLSLPADLDQLSINARRVDAAILILDPLMSRLHDSLDTHRDGDVRKALEPLADMAEKTGMATLGIIHHNKSGSSDPLQLVMASKAFAAVARSVHTVIRDPDDDTQNQKLFGTSKNNLGTMDLPTLTFTIRPWTYPTDDGDGTTGQILWGAQRQESIGEALARTVRDPDEKSALDEAVEWLADYLDDTGGRAEAGLAQTAARAAGINERTLRRARVKLGVDKRKTGFQGTWEWFMPERPTETDKIPGAPELVPFDDLVPFEPPRGQIYRRGQGCVSPEALSATSDRFDNSPLPAAGSRSGLFSPPPAGPPNDDCRVCHAPHHPTTFHRCQCPTCTQENTP